MTDQALDRLARRVLLDVARQEYGCLIEARPEHEFSPSFEKKMKKLLRRARHPAWHKFVQTAACLLLVLLLAGCAVLAVSPAAREVFASWVREIYEDQYIYHLHPEYDRNNPVDEIALPETAFRPTWMPEGYQIIQEMIDDGISLIVYWNDSDNSLAILQRMHGGTVQVVRDEGDTYTQVLVHGKPADFYLDQDEGEQNVLIWEDGDMVCILTALFSDAEMIKVAESMEAQELPKMYQPAWVPDGYHGRSVGTSKDGRGEIHYIGDIGGRTCTMEWNYAPFSIGEELFADREADALPVLVNSSPAELYLGVDEEGANELVWKDEEKELFFWIRGSVTEKELIKMAESMEE